MRNLDLVKGMYLNKLEELGRSVDENVVIRYNFGNDSYSSESESNILLSKSNCIQTVRTSILKDTEFMNTLESKSDDEYEESFKSEVVKRMEKFATKIDMGLGIKEHFILEVA